MSPWGYLRQWKRARMASALRRSYEPRRKWMPPIPLMWVDMWKGLP